MKGRKWIAVLMVVVLLLQVLSPLKVAAAPYPGERQPYAQESFTGLLRFQLAYDRSTHGGNIQPNVACEGFVTFYSYSCALNDPLNPCYACTNWCYVGGTWKCLGESACVAFYYCQ